MNRFSGSASCLFYHLKYPLRIQTLLIIVAVRTTAVTTFTSMFLFLMFMVMFMFFLRLMSVFVWWMVSSLFLLFVVFWSVGMSFLPHFFCLSVHFWGKSVKKKKSFLLTPKGFPIDRVKSSGVRQRNISKCHWYLQEWWG